MKLSSVADLEKRIVALQKDTEIAIANQNVAHQKDLAIHREANAKLQVEIGKLEGKIKGLEISQNCPRCNELEQKMLGFIESMTKIAMGIQYKQPSPFIVTPGYATSEKHLTGVGSVGTYIYGNTSGFIGPSSASVSNK